MFNLKTEMKTKRHCVYTMQNENEKMHRSCRFQYTKQMCVRIHENKSHKKNTIHFQAITELKGIEIN